jgi:glycosyltransferase involved in cell wall biosynthesis
MRRPLQRRSIMFVIGTLEVGGAEAHLTDVARALVKRGWDVSIHCIARGGPLQSKLKDGGVRVFLPPTDLFRDSPHIVSLLVNRFWRQTAALSLWARMVQRRPAIVHFFLPGAYIIGAPVAIAALRPIRVMSRRSLNRYQEKSPRWRRLEHVLHPWMTAILGNSARIIEELAREGVRDGQAGVIYNGVDLERFQLSIGRDATRKKLEISSDALVLTIVANLIPYKGHADLIDALGFAANEMPAGWQLLLVGRDDGIGSQLRARAVSKGLDRSIRFLGARADIADILKASDIGILSSHEEGFSNALLEGMAAGLPMIATDVGGNREALEDGVSGIIVPAQDPRRLAAAILRLAKDADLRKRFGTAACERVSQKFTLESCVRSYDLFYRELLSGRRPGEIAHIQLR